MDEKREKRTLLVVWFTLLMMLAEIAVGIASGSMALLADGFHMGTHALALSIAVAAYFFMRKYSNSKKFKSGTEKIGELAGFSSSLFLGLSGVGIVVESLARFVNPVDISFSEAIWVAVLGLAVNLVCAAIMNGGTHFHHSHDHGDDNFSAAYLHILADALTSLLAIIALLFGKYLGWAFLDPVMGIVGGCVILKWSFGLLKRTSIKLLDIAE